MLTPIGRKASRWSMRRWLSRFSSSSSCSNSSSNVSTDISSLPLDVELPGIPKLQPGENLETPQMKITTLSNGIKVASEEDYGQVSSVGVFMDVGSRFENDDNNGVSYLIEKMAFRSTNNRTGTEIMRDIECIGGNVITSSSREQIVFQLEFLRSELETAIDLLADNILCPTLHDADIDEVKDMIGYEKSELQYDPQNLVTEWIHEAAFGAKTPLGRPTMTPDHQLTKLNASHIRDFMNDYFVGSKMVIAAAGVDHDELVYRASQKFGSLPMSTEVSKREIELYEYKGGAVIKEEEPPQLAVSETFVEPPPPMTHIMLAFETGGWRNSEDLVPLCVLQTLLGGGSSFSAGGPGKGMYTRLYLEVLNYNDWVESSLALTHLLYDNGLFGIYGTSEPQFAFALVKSIVEQLYTMGTTHATPIELSRARNQLKSRILMNLESRNVLCEDIGRQLLTYQEREHASSLCRKVDNVTEQDLSRVAQKMLKTAPSMVAYGSELDKIPAYEEINKFFSVFRH